MSLKKYDELTITEKELVRVMYTDQDTVKQYLYNFDGPRYIGRQYVPPSGVDEKVGLYGTIVSEPLVQEPEEVKEDQPEVEEKQKTRKRTTKKK